MQLGGCRGEDSPPAPPTTGTTHCDTETRARARAGVYWQVAVIHDRRLGVLHYAFTFGIFVYIVLWNIVMQKGYMLTEQPGGSVRSVRPPLLSSLDPFAKLEIVQAACWYVVACFSPNPAPECV